MSGKMRLWFGILIFLNGFLSMALELTVLRGLAYYVGSSAVITGIIMGTFLGFMSLGYVLGESKYIRENKIKTILGISFLVIALFMILASTFGFITHYFTTMYAHGIQSGIAQTFIFSGLFLSVGPFLFGFNTTLLSRLLKQCNAGYTGNILAWDTIGGVAGSMLTTLILMPFIGVNYTIVLIVALSVMVAFMVRPHILIGAVGIGLIVGAVMFNSNAYLKRQFGIIVNNANSTISVSEFYNGVENMRVLDMNGLPMSLYAPGTRRGAGYINYINDIFLSQMPRDRVRKVLVLGAGGFTAGLNDTFHDYTYVDIEPTLREVTEKYFLGEKLTPNKKFIVADASQFLKNTPTDYDIIILDVYSNSYQVPENLITAEFMARIKSRIAPNGIIIMNMIVSPIFNDKYSRVFDNTFHTVFPHNTQRQVIGHTNPWNVMDTPNVLYIYYNRENDGRIYTINKTPVIYDR